MLSPRFLFLSASIDHGIGSIYNPGGDPMAVFTYLSEAGDAFGWRLCGARVTVAVLHEVARSAAIGLLLLVLPLFFLGD